MQKPVTFSGRPVRRQNWVRKPNKVSGFTLIELIVTVVIVGILAATAVPSFRSLITSQRVKTASFDLTAALIQTRSEAIKRNADVSMVPSGGDWASGWTIVSGATTLRSQPAHTGGLCITEATDATCVTANTLTFGGNGRLKTTATAFTIGISPLTATADNITRCVNISLSGQASSKFKHQGTGAC